MRVFLISLATLYALLMLTAATVHLRHTVDLLTHIDAKRS